jgi:HSP20 family protein
MVRWNPYREFAAFERALNPSQNGGRVWRPALDVVENDDAYIVRASLPGLKAEDIDVNVEDDVLTIKAERSEEHEESDEHYLMRERTYGAYRRSVRLPSGVDGDNTTAQFEDGVLTLTLAKREEFKPKRIEVAVK